MVCGVKRPHLGFLRVETISVAPLMAPLPWRILKGCFKEILSVDCKQMGDMHVCSGFSGQCIFVVLAQAGTYSSFAPGRFSLVAVASSCLLFTLEVAPIIPQGSLASVGPLPETMRGDQESSAVLLLHPHPWPHRTIAGSSWSHLALQVPFCRCRG